MNRTATGTRQLGYRFITIVLGIILLAAGFFKGADLDQFALQIRQYGILPDDSRLAFGVAWFMVVVEIFLGAALVVNWRPKASLSGVIMLLLLFIGALLWAISHGGVADCGCFGPAVSRSPGEALIEDFLLLLSAVGAWRLRDTTVYFRHPMKSWFVATASVLAITLPAIMGTVPPGRSVVSPEVGDEGTGMVLQSTTGDRVDLNSGTFLLALMSTECNHCRESVPLLNEIVAGIEDVVTVYAVAADDPSDINRFIEDNFAFYPVLPIDEKTLSSLMRKDPLPQYLLIRNGQIVNRWHEQVPELRALVDLAREFKGA